MAFLRTRACIDIPLRCWSERAADTQSRRE